MIITKELIKKLADNRDNKPISRHYSVLVVPDTVELASEIVDYANYRNVAIKYKARRSIIHIY